VLLFVSMPPASAQLLHSETLSENSKERDTYSILLWLIIQLSWIVSEV
jgi:hypothetical protein